MSEQIKIPLNWDCSYRLPFTSSDSCSTPESIGADPAGTAVVAVAGHNADATAHGLRVSWATPQQFGIVADGTDCATAIQAAIDSLPATGGTLFFPRGTYTTASGFVVSKPLAIEGEGVGAWYMDGDNDYIGGNNTLTTINCTSRTAKLFDVQTQVSSVRNIRLVNTATLAPTAGAAIYVACTTEDQKCDVSNCVVIGFYDGIVQGGAYWIISESIVSDTVRDGIQIRNIVNPDSGDWCISNVGLSSGKHTTARAALRIEGSGGGKITNLKVNTTHSGTGFFYTNGIQLVPQAGVHTGQLIASNVIIENIKSSAIVIANEAGSEWSVIHFSNLYIHTFADTPIVLTSAATDNLVNVMFQGVTIIGEGSNGAAFAFTECGAMLSNIRFSGDLTSLYSTSGICEIIDMGLVGSQRTIGNIVVGDRTFGGDNGPVIYHKACPNPGTNFAFKQNSGGYTFINGTSVALRVADTSRLILDDFGNMTFAATNKPTVTGSRGGNAALASLLTALAAYGLIVDSSS